MITTCWPSIGTLYFTSSAWMPSGVHGRGASGTPMTSLPRLTGCRPSASLSGSIARSAASASRCSGQRHLQDVRVDVRVAVVAVDDLEQLLLRHRSREARCGSDRTPISAESSRFRRTYAWLGGSSPTRIVPSPGVMPFSLEPLDARAQVVLDGLQQRVPVEQRGGHQWRKCRSPVNTIARPSSSARSMTASSRIAPPGWITAATPGFGRGFDAVGERIERVARGRAALGAARRPSWPRSRPTRRGSVGPAPIPDRLAVFHEHDRVRLHVPADAPRELEVAPLFGRRRNLGHHAPVVARRREVVRVLDEEAAGDLAEVQGFFAGQRGLEDARVLALAAQRLDRARLRSPGAITRSACGPATIRSTVAVSIGRFNATIPPNAERSSHSSARWYAVRERRHRARRRTGSRA